MKKPLRNDCFALPPGVHWTPVREALDRLRAALEPVVETGNLPLEACLGRVLARDAVALRDHPPFANSAVDGYGFAHEAASGDPMPLDRGRAAAGEPFVGKLPPGQAVRVLTGAKIPEGVDTVVLQEDVTLEDGAIRFETGLKPGANVRPKGEDISKGAVLCAAHDVIRPGDIAMLASAGVRALDVFRPLRVAVLSTGNELAEGAEASSDQIFDANRPMLKSIVRGWGMEIVDLGQVADDRGSVRAALSRGAIEADVIISTGGASAGDEDHISAVLRDEGVLETWRIAIKPGRPLAMGLWQGTPLFGLPGNPVAAFVCMMVFAKPALRVLAGGEWAEPVPIPLAASFTKKKKPGRVEYLRARRNGDQVDVFASEGSGRVSGLSWADGLVFLDSDDGPVAPGDPVPYIPLSAFYTF